MENDLPHLSDAIDRIMTSELFHEQANLYMDEDDNEPDDVLILHMDIREPLSTLQKLAEQKVGFSLKGYKFWLQDAQELEPHKNLVDQCVKGEGLVQINVQIQTTNARINIVDVLKPTEAALALAAEEALRNSLNSTDKSSNCEEESQDSHTSTSTEPQPKPDTTKATLDKDDKPCLNWVLDRKFKKEQALLKMPEDPNEWTVPQVMHWFQWAVREFDLTNTTMTDWAINGKTLCTLTHEEFRKKLPLDPGNVFWTHLQLLKECKFVSVVHKAVEQDLVAEPASDATTTTSGTSLATSTKEMRIMRKCGKTPLFTTLDTPSANSVGSIPPTAIVATSAPVAPTYGIGSGNNGQVQLWQFLLEILTDREHVNIIQWVGTEGEFKLTDPERVARLWGEKKNKPAMNYEKLSRALRYYYDGDMISKVSGKRFAYKFDCDLKLLIGYDAAELSQLVNERSYLDESVYLDHINTKPADD